MTDERGERFAALFRAAYLTARRDHPRIAAWSEYRIAATGMYYRKPQMYPTVG